MSISYRDTVTFMTCLGATPADHHAQHTNKEPVRVGYLLALGGGRDKSSLR
jgi:hypothetical protein